MTEKNIDQVEEVERQLARSSYHAQTAHTRLSERMNESEHYLFGLLDLLMEKGVLTQEELQAKLDSVADEIEKRAKQYATGVSLYVDKGEGMQEPAINCEERLHICKAACCRLSFPLSVEDLELGKVKWDFGKPYYIRHTTEGRCVHLNQGSCQCGVYEHRPKTCKGYSCADDKRIWKDFDNMILNDEWIDVHLNAEKVVLTRKPISQAPQERNAAPSMEE